MKVRFNYVEAAPGAFKAMLGLGQYLQECGLEGSLLNLIKLRASQINGCGYALEGLTGERGGRATAIFIESLA
jgi:alkylhydroperoxidase family enzyme